MTPAKAQAAKWLKEAVEQQVEDLTVQWAASTDPEDRERIHAEVTATIKLEDSINARIERKSND